MEQFWREALFDITAPHAGFAARELAVEPNAFTARLQQYLELRMGVARLGCLERLWGREHGQGYSGVLTTELSRRHPELAEHLGVYGLVQIQAGEGSRDTFFSRAHELSTTYARNRLRLDEAPDAKIMVLHQQLFEAKTGRPYARDCVLVCNSPTLRAHLYGEFPEAPRAFCPGCGVPRGAEAVTVGNATARVEPPLEPLEGKVCATCTGPLARYPVQIQLAPGIVALEFVGGADPQIYVYVDEGDEQVSGMDAIDAVSAITGGTVSTLRVHEATHGPPVNKLDPSIDNVARVRRMLASGPYAYLRQLRAHPEFAQTTSALQVVNLVTGLGDLKDEAFRHSEFAATVLEHIETLLTQMQACSADADRLITLHQLVVDDLHLILGVTRPYSADQLRVSVLQSFEERSPAVANLGGEAFVLQNGMDALCTPLSIQRAVDSIHHDTPNAIYFELKKILDDAGKVDLQGSSITACLRINNPVTPVDEDPRSRFEHWQVIAQRVETALKERVPPISLILDVTVETERPDERTVLDQLIERLHPAVRAETLEVVLCKSYAKYASQGAGKAVAGGVVLFSKRSVSPLRDQLSQSERDRDVATNPESQLAAHLIRCGRKDELAMAAHATENARLARTLFKPGSVLSRFDADVPFLKLENTPISGPAGQELAELDVRGLLRALGSEHSETFALARTNDCFVDDDCLRVNIGIEPRTVICEKLFCIGQLSFEPPGTTTFSVAENRATMHAVLLSGLRQLAEIEGLGSRPFDVIEEVSLATAVAASIRDLEADASQEATRKAMRVLSAGLAAVKPRAFDTMDRMVSAAVEHLGALDIDVDLGPEFVAPLRVLEELGAQARQQSRVTFRGSPITASDLIEHASQTLRAKASEATEPIESARLSMAWAEIPNPNDISQVKLHTDKLFDPHLVESLPDCAFANNKLASCLLAEVELCGGVDNPPYDRETLRTFLVSGLTNVSLQMQAVLVQKYCEGVLNSTEPLQQQLGELKAILPRLPYPELAAEVFSRLGEAGFEELPPETREGMAGVLVDRLGAHNIAVLLYRLIEQKQTLKALFVYRRLLHHADTPLDIVGSALDAAYRPFHEALVELEQCETRWEQLSTQQEELRGRLLSGLPNRDGGKAPFTEAFPAATVGSWVGALIVDSEEGKRHRKLLIALCVKADGPYRREWKEWTDRQRALAKAKERAEVLGKLVSVDEEFRARFRRPAR